MEPLKLSIHEVDTNEENPYLDAVYQGKPFTGVIWDEWNGEYTETPYVEGLAHGRAFCRFDNGALAWEELLDHGQVMESTAWWPKGQVIRHRQTAASDQYFYQDGTLCREQTAEHLRLFYPAGRLKEETLYGEEAVSLVFYGQDGAWAVRGRFPYTFQRSYTLERSGLVFNEPYLLTHAAQLLEESHMDFQKYLTLWLPRWDRKKSRRLFGPWEKEAPPQVRQVICGLIRSQDLAVKYAGINLAGTYHVTEAIPLLEKALSIRKTPPSHRSIESGGLTGVSYGHTIAQRAQIALAQLR